ncbi:hypothetical protein DYB34_003166 [Aphanomyces astaci]|uniref:RING-type domain-containing protein n=1 Tax=Aphanomyces astaci TaxID=112090 RepID=A0A397ETM8_APHAT|nr:hypothetical protein DYB34_003166 [Aphanomyces astaci]RHY98117.1 hypothetical protein DYB31_004354 [Aphanomyces astaci]
MVVLTASDTADAIAKATKGFDDLVSFSQVYVDQDKKKYSSSAQPTPTSSFAIHHAPMIGTLDSLTANCNDAVQVCTEHTTLLCTLSPSISVQHSVLKSPIPFVRDRDAVFSQVQRSYVDSKGRQCYAWYRTSLAAVAAPATACIRATVNSWGCVLVQVTPHTLTQFTVMDVDWSGNVSSWVAARLASKLVAPLTLVGHRASSAPSSATISREPPKVINNARRCAMCRVKPSMGKRDLVVCVACSHVVCQACSDLSVTSPRCLSCLLGMRKRNVSVISSTEPLTASSSSSSSMVSTDVDCVTPRTLPACKSTMSHRNRRKLWSSKQPSAVTDLGYVAELYPGI